MKKFIIDNWIVLVIGSAFFTSTVLAVRNNDIIKRNLAIQNQTELIKQLTQDILYRTMHGLDLGIRGFALTHDNKLLKPFEEAVEVTPQIFRRLDSLLVKQEYPGIGTLKDVQHEVNQYVKFSNEMLVLARADSMKLFTEMLRKDKGFDVWSKYTQFATPLFLHEDNLNKHALQDYQDAIRNNLLLQLAILVLALPMLFIFVVRIKKERTSRHALITEVEKTDKTYVFNSGTDEVFTAEQINRQSIQNVRQASEFIQSMARGEYNVEWSGLSSVNQTLNQNTLAGNLVELRDKLRRVKQEDDRRNWSNEGLAKFSEIVRNFQNNGEELHTKCISFLTKYLDAQQGSLFIREGEADNIHLKLSACYAFDRKKWVEKRIEIGQGILGQAYLEGEPVRLKSVPKDYIAISSGLGDATPKFVLIVPMKYNGETQAIIEIATFYDVEDYHIAFLQKAGEFLTSAIVNTETTLKMKNLLEEATAKEIQMHQREEELQQNMEELQATQEELVRRQRE